MLTGYVVCICCICYLLSASVVVHPALLCWAALSKDDAPLFVYSPRGTKAVREEDQ